MKVFAVIPALNAEATIQEVVRGLRERVFVVVVDDGSEDRTFDRAKEAGADVLRHLVNRGQGAALATGVTYALEQGADIVVHFDADGQHRVSDAERMIARMEGGDVDVVLGSRVLGGMRFEGWEAVKLAGKRLVDRFFTGVSLTDVHNGLRVMNRRAAELIQIRQDRMAHATEIIAEIRRHRLRFVEFPVMTLSTEYSRARSANRHFLRASVKIVRDLVVGKVIR